LGGKGKSRKTGGAGECVGEGEARASGGVDSGVPSLIRALKGLIVRRGNWWWEVVNETEGGGKIRDRYKSKKMGLGCEEVFGDKTGGGVISGRWDRYFKGCRAEVELKLY